MHLPALWSPGFAPHPSNLPSTECFLKEWALLWSRVSCVPIVSNKIWNSYHLPGLAHSSLPPLAPLSSHPILSTPSGLSVHPPNNAPGSFLSRILGWYSSPASNAPDLPRFRSYHLLIIQLSALLWLPHSVYPWTLVRLTCHTLPQIFSFTAIFRIHYSLCDYLISIILLDPPGSLSVCLSLLRAT